MKTFILAAAFIGGAIIVLMAINNKPLPSENSTPSTHYEDISKITIPADLPNNIPMYPEAVLNKSSESNTNSERNVTLTLHTTASIPDIVTWYRGALSTDGWAVTDDKNVGGYILLKGEQENITVFVQSASGEDGQTVITQRIRIR